MKQQETVKLLVHSFIDLITNSSTEIFVHSKDSLKPAKELLTEFLKISGSDKTFDEVFEITLKLDSDNIREYMSYYLDDFEKKELGLDDLLYEEQNDKIHKIINEIMSGERKFKFQDDYHIQTYIEIKSKDSKYDVFIKQLESFLYSPEWYEHSNG